MSDLADRDMPYLTMVSWPAAWDRWRLAEHLARATGLDSTDLHLHLGATPPRILGPFDPAIANAAAEATCSAGGDAFVFTLAHLEHLGPTLKVRDLEIASGTLLVELWRGPPASVPLQAIDVVVRARQSETVGMRPPPPEMTASAAPLGVGLMAWGMGGAYGWATRLRAIETFRDLTSFEKRVRVSHKLDFHASDGRVFQIDGDKFGYRILGELRGHSDLVNIDRMCELFTHLNPEVVVDPYFPIWHPPPGFRRLRLPMLKINNEDPAFAFYSRWAAMLYRHVMGG